MKCGRRWILLIMLPAILAVLSVGVLSAAATVLATPPRSIAGSTVTTSAGYDPGNTALFCATAHNTSTDVEWLDAVTLTFPSGWAVACNWQDTHDSCGNEVSFECSDPGNVVVYWDDDGGYGEIYGDCSWSFCADLMAAGGASGPQIVDWGLSGDDWGDPPHDLAGTVNIAECGWLDGYVMDLETGDVEPTCTGAFVSMEPGGLKVPVDPASGYYGPVALMPGMYSVGAWAPGYSEEGASVDVLTGMTTTQDFNLWRPAIEVAPTDFISITAVISKEETHRLTVFNPGHMPLEFEIAEDSEAPLDLPWVWEDPISGTVPGPGEIGIDVTFHCTETRDYNGMLAIFHNDPCQGPVEVPIAPHCVRERCYLPLVVKNY